MAGHRRTDQIHALKLGAICSVPGHDGLGESDRQKKCRSRPKNRINALHRRARESDR